MLFGGKGTAKVTNKEKKNSTKTVKTEDNVEKDPKILALLEQINAIKKKQAQDKVRKAEE